MTGALAPTPLFDLPRCELGEGPRWDAATQSLLFVDITGQAIHRVAPSSGAVETFATDAVTGFALLDERGRLVAGLGGSIHALDLGSDKRRLLARPDMHPDNRFNDAGCDPRGRLWAGTMHTDASRAREPTGTLYRVETVRRSSKAAKLRATVGAIDSDRLRRLLAEAEHAVESSLAAFRDSPETAERADRGDEPNDLRKLESTLSELADELAPAFASTLRSLTESIAAAQAHVMAFALNRANHGDPDSSQLKAREKARETFQSEAEPLLAALKSAAF